MFDILTVVFEEELDYLRVQAQSIELYCKDIGIKNIFVIVNDDKKIVEKINTEWYGSLSKFVKVIPRQQLGTYYHSEGWISQQYLKLKGTTLSDNKWVMVLDAKSYFIKTIHLTKLFDIFGRIKSGCYKIGPEWKTCKDNLDKLFDIDLKSNTGRVPYLFRVDLVSDLIDFVERKTGQPFDKWFHSFDYGHITEISLYFGYVQYRYKHVWKYTTKDRYILSECAGRNRIDRANKIFDTEIVSVKTQRKSHVVMIHRQVWSVLDEERKDKYRKFLISRGLTTAEIL